jgi:hypothetical protein
MAPKTYVKLDDIVIPEQVVKIQVGTVTYNIVQGSYKEVYVKDDAGKVFELFQAELYTSNSKLIESKERPGDWEAVPVRSTVVGNLDSITALVMEH